MPKKTNSSGDRYIEAAINSILKMKQEGESNRDLFVRIYNRPPNSQSELNTFTNRLRVDRANPSAAFIGEVVAAHEELKSMAMGEFFGLED